MTTVLVVGGTTESYPGDERTDVSGILRGVTDRLDARFHARWVGYPAEYARWNSFRDSVDEGVRRLSDLVRSTPGDIAVLGYSQGCTVVRAYLDDAARNGEPHDTRVKAAGLVADPEAPPLAGQPDRFGVLGHSLSAIPEWVQPYWASNPRDPICAARYDSLLREFADYTEWFGFGDLIKWGTDFLDTLRTADLGDVTPEAVAVTIAEIQAYLPRWPIGPFLSLNPPGGQHVEVYATSPHLLPGLASWLNARA